MGGDYVTRRWLCATDRPTDRACGGSSETGERVEGGMRRDVRPSPSSYRADSDSFRVRLHGTGPGSGWTLARNDEKLEKKRPG